jgi:zinc protease
MSVVIVGDIDPVKVEQKIIETFSPLKARAPAAAAPDLGKLPTFNGVPVFYHYESEAPSTSVSISTIVPWRREPDNAANRLKDLPRSLAHAMINRRLSVLAKKEGAPFNGGSASVDESYNFYREASISLSCREDQWMGALAVADQELRRALEHGFQPVELKEIIANFRNSLEQAVKTAATRRSDSIAYAIADSLLEREVFTTPEADLALFGPALDKVTVQDCLNDLRELWKPAHRLVMVTGNARIAGGGSTVAGAMAPQPGSPQATIASAYEKSRAVAVKPPEAIEDAKWAYTDFGPAGTVTKREHVADLDVHLVTFANGVRLNLKQTDFEANRIRISLRIGNGGLVEPKDKPGLSFYTNQTYTEGGLGKHSVDDLRRVLAGKTVSASFGVGGDAFVSGGTTNREDLLLQMQFMTARLTDPGYRPEAARQALKNIDQMYLSFAHTPGGPFNLVVPKLISSGDHRFGLPPKEELLKRNLDEVKAWLTPELAKGAIEVAMVGDLDVDATIAAVAQTLGALPKRDPRPALDELRNVKFPSEPFNREFTIDSDIPKGTVVTYWPTTDGREIRRTRRLGMLGEVFSDRLRIKVREELGDAYSPGAGSSAGELYPGYGYMQASVTVDPPRAKEVTDIIVSIAGEIAEKGITEDELERAKKPVLTSLRESARTNQYWLANVLSRAQEKPEMLDWSRSRYTDNESISKADIDALAKSYLGSNRASRVIVIPQKGGGGGTAASAKGAP